MSDDVRAFELTEAESLLFENAETELKDMTDSAKAIYRKRTAAILRSHGLDPATIPDGHFQRDPLLPSQWRFLYRVVESAENAPLALPPGEP